MHAPNQHPQSSLDLKEAIPGSEYVLFEGGGHALVSLCHRLGHLVHSQLTSPPHLTAIPNARGTECQIEAGLRRGLGEIQCRAGPLIGRTVTSGFVGALHIRLFRSPCTLAFDNHGLIHNYGYGSPGLASEDRCKARPALRLMQNR